MAEVLIAREVCDLCNHLQMSNVPAAIKHRIQLDDGPLKEYDHCEHSERMIGWVLDYLRDHGQVVELPDPGPKARERPARKRQERTKPVAAKKPRELPPTPLETPAQEKETEGKPQPAAKPPKPQLWCPEPHKSQHGAGMMVAYVDRGSHADMCHDNARLWDIAWEDPDGIIEVYCTSHAECMKTNIGFTTQRGLDGHVRTSPLQRIDLDEGPSE